MKEKRGKKEVELHVVKRDKLRKERLERAQRSLKTHGVDALVTFEPQNIYYITDTLSPPFTIFWRYSLLARGGAIMLWELGADLAPLKESASWLDGRIMPSIPLAVVPDGLLDKWASNLRESIKSLGLADGVLGFDQTSMRVRAALERQKIEYVDGASVMRDARAVKTDEEIKCIRNSVRLAEVGFDRAVRTIKPGIMERELQAEIARVLIARGCTGLAGPLATGRNTSPYWRIFANDKKIRHGDLVIIDRVHCFSPYGIGYWCDYTRTFLCGERATKEQKELHKKCYDSLYYAINAVKPGNTTKDVAERLDDPEDFSTCTLNFAHGMGLQAQEYPVILKPVARKNPVEIKPNMVLAVETYASASKKRLGVRLEENLLVTETGYEILSKYPFDSRLAV